MGMLRIDHPDILDFIHAKGELTEENQELYNEFEATLAATDLSEQEIADKLKDYKRQLLDNQFSNFNLSVGITADFMQAVKEDKEYDLVNPRTKEVVGQLSARKVFNLIVNYAWKNGEPGIVFLDEVNNQHPLPEEIEATNPCGEQPLLPDEACNLGSINLSKFVKDGEVLWDQLQETIKLAVRLLDNVVSVNEYPLPKIEEKVLQYRKIGLGVMGFHELLIRLGIPYNSQEAVEMADQVMEFINEQAHQSSQELAAEKGAFPAYEESEYQVPQRNATLTTIAPTGSISFLGGTSGGIEPFFSFKYSHTDADGNVSHFEYDFTADAPEEALVTALDIEPEWHVKIQAAFQDHVDNAVSKTINFPNQATKEDIAQAYQLAYELGCKGLTVYRNGSRTAQVLSTDDDNQEEKQDDQEQNKSNGESIYPEKRPLAAAGETIMYNTGCGKLYLTINFDQDGNPIETFLTTGSEGGCQVMTEGVSRLTSLALRSGIAPKEIIDQLKSTTTCPSFMYEKGTGQELEGRSCPDVVARALEEITEAKTFQHSTSDLEVIQELEEAKSQTAVTEEDKPLCPECGEELHFEQGCDSCKNCGYSSCG